MVLRGGSGKASILCPLVHGDFHLQEMWVLLQMILGGCKSHLTSNIMLDHNRNPFWIFREESKSYTFCLTLTPLGMIGGKDESFDPR